MLTIASAKPQQGLKDFTRIRQEINAEIQKMDSSISAKAFRINSESLKDTAKMNTWRRVSINESRIFNARRLEILRDIGAIVYPDIRFNDAEGKTWALSDFPNDKIMLNFNYSFCDPCMNFIDTLASACADNCKLIVLLPDNPDQSQAVIDKYGSKALIGFTSIQYKSHYSLNSGTYCVFLLSKGRYISYLYDPDFTKESRKYFLEQVNSWP